jgi:hypothetical protein
MDKIRERVLDGEPSSSTLVAERQVLEFLIGPRATKTTKKRSAFKILHKLLQSDTSD